MAKPTDFNQIKRVLSMVLPIPSADELHRAKEEISLPDCSESEDVNATQERPRTLGALKEQNRISRFDGIAARLMSGNRI